MFPCGDNLGVCTACWLQVVPRRTRLESAERSLVMRKSLIRLGCVGSSLLPATNRISWPLSWQRGSALFDPVRRLISRLTVPAQASTTIAPLQPGSYTCEKMSRGPSNLLSSAPAQHQRGSWSRPNFAKADGWPDRCLSSFTNFLLRCLLPIVIIRSAFPGSGVDRGLLRLVRCRASACACLPAAFPALGWIFGRPR